MTAARRTSPAAAAVFALFACNPAAAQLVLKSAATTTPWLSAFNAMVVATLALALAYAVLRHLRRRIDAPAAPGGARPPQLVHSRRLTQKTVLLVVRWQDRTYLLAETGQTLQVLDDVVEPGSLP